MATTTLPDDGEELEKAPSSVGESDPQTLAEHQMDPPGSFLDVYRSLNTDNLQLDQDFVNKSVLSRVIPQSIRYGMLRRGRADIYRGVVKSTQGDYHYFNWVPGTQFRLVPADDHTKQLEADQIFRSCKFGCDLRKADAPLDPGETVDQATEDDDEKAGPAAEPILSEQQNIAEQQSDTTNVHPGSTAAATPDDGNNTRDWHGEEAITRAQDVMGPLGGTETNGKQNWTATQLLKSWGEKLQKSAPVTQQPVHPLEAQYMREAMGLPETEIRKGMQLPARYRASFEAWKASRLQTKLSVLQQWLKR